MHQQGTQKTRLGWGRGLGTVVLLILAVATLSIAAWAKDGAAQPPASGSPLAAMLEKLHGALAALDDRVDAVGWTGLAQPLEGTRALLDTLIQELGAAPQPGRDPPAIKDEVIKLDGLLHRLLDALERLADGGGPASGRSPAQTPAEETIAELRTYLEGYPRDVSASLDRVQLAELERAARALLEEIGRRITGSLPPAPTAKSQEPRLDLLTKEIGDLLERLDQFILHAFVLPRSDGPATAP